MDKMNEAIDFFTSFALNCSPSWAIKYCSDNGRLNFAEHVIAREPKIACQYAKEIIKGRWKECEPYVSKNGEASFEYAFNVIKGRFVEGEKAIVEQDSSPNGIAFLYARHIIKGRFPELEKAIANNAESSFEYAVQINERFFEGEKSIVKSRIGLIFQYATLVIKGRFVEAEDKIIKKTKWMLEYAKRVIGGKLPDELHTAMTMQSFSNPNDRSVKTYFEKYGK